MKTNNEIEIDKSVLEVRLLGEFQLKSKDGVLNETNIHSEKVTQLLTYFLCHRNHPISVQKIGEVLWRDESSDNPAGALKNLMYRLRSIMKAKCGNSELIITGSGSYSWNPEIKTRVDAEEFEKLCKLAQGMVNEEDKINCYLQALGLYSGTFLPKQASEVWIAPLAMYYHSLYLNAVESVSCLLDARGRYCEMFDICSQAIDKDALEEQIYYYLIKALIGQNKMKQAIQQYRNATTLLYDQLGVQPSKELCDLYKELLKKNHQKELNLTIIQQELDVDHEDKGAFLCEFGIFKEVYQLELRRAPRLGVSMYLCLITLEVSSYVNEESEAYLLIVKEAMEGLEHVLMSYLRSGDTVARYSANQFVLMLPTCNYESAKNVMRRIQEGFHVLYKKKKAKMIYSLDEILLNQA
ncbi:MAG: BTAD domain-containing putative transcriptional regulator [Lachnospiraceae bacterium]